ncbi:MAG: SDR family oxidoreductase [Pseudomonadota bacterium]
MTITKTALVTGGGTRIGTAICKGLAEAGYAIALHYNSSSESADRIVAEIEGAGGKAVAVQADLTDSTQTRSLFGKAVDAVGPIGVLINNASLFEEDAPHTIDDELWDAHFNVHARAPTLLAADFNAQFDDARASGDNSDMGLIINMIDERVWKLTPNFTSYTLSKSTLWTATRTLAQAFAPQVRVNAIGPGPTLPSKRQTQDDFDRQISTLLLQRPAQLDEFVSTILYLANASAVTGQMIALDGGQHLGWDTADQRVPE